MLPVPEPKDAPLPRLTLLFVAAALVVTGCSDDADSPTTTTSIGATETTTTLADTDTDAPAPDTTVAGDTSTTLVATPPEGAPTTVLDSFTATSVVVVNVGDNPITVTTEGTRVGEAFECTATVVLAETTVVTSTIVTLDGAWIDDGEGYQEADIETITDVVSSCPLHPVFWADFDTSLCPTDMTGTAETVNGIPAQRVDLSATAELATCMRFTADLEGADFAQYDTWLADDGGWIVALTMDAALDAEAASRAFGGLPEEGVTAELSMAVEIADVNDPSLVVEAPET